MVNTLALADDTLALAVDTLARAMLTWRVSAATLPRARAPQPGSPGSVVSPSEIMFLALGLVLGVAIGAGLIGAFRARPARRREVRLTITPNAIPARRAHTLAVLHGTPHPGRNTGSHETDVLARPPVPVIAATAVATASVGAQAAPGRTRVPSAAVVLPGSAVAVPVGQAASAQARATRPDVDPPRPPANSSPGPGTAATAPRPAVVAEAAIVATRVVPTAVSVLDVPEGPGTAAGLGALRTPAPASMALNVPAALNGPAHREATRRDVAFRGDGFTTLVRPRGPVDAPRPTLVAGAVAVTARAAAAANPSAFAPVARPALAPPPGPTLTRPRASSRPPEAPGPRDAAGAPDAAPDPCAGQRRVVDERCGLADVAREQARRAADTLREARRAFDTLNERVDRASDQANPRHVAAAKERLHAMFRAASNAAGSPDETEAAARAWLNEINTLNGAVREAQRIVESGTAELRVRLPALERLSAEADAARIAGENAEFGCREAREDLAGCEEADARSREAAASRPQEPHPFAGVWPEDSPNLPDATPPTQADLLAGLPAIVRVLRGDREAHDRLVARLSAGDPESGRDWQLRVSRLADAIIGRAIEDGYLDLPEDDPFWRLFSQRESRDIVGALSALGFRFDGMGGFADGRAPAARDLSLAVGYAGLDRMRIRTWPRDAEIAVFYERAVVAADEWLADQAGDLSLGRMVDALGGRAADLADVWNAWGRVRPALLAT